MKQVGILLNNLGPSQLAFSVLRSVNTAQGYSPIIFVERQAPMIGVPLCPVMHVSECFAYRAPLIATDFETAQIALTCVSPIKFFYVNDLEWTRWPQRHYRILQKVYGKIPLLARSEEHSQVLRTWSPVKVIGDFCLERILA